MACCAQRARACPRPARLFLYDTLFPVSYTHLILKTGQKKLIGFIVPDISNEYFSALIEEVERTVASQSYKLIVTRCV